MTISSDPFLDDMEILDPRRADIESFRLYCIQFPMFFTCEDDPHVAYLYYVKEKGGKDHACRLSESIKREMIARGADSDEGGRFVNELCDDYVE